MHICTYRKRCEYAPVEINVYIYICILYCKEARLSSARLHALAERTVAESKEARAAAIRGIRMEEITMPTCCTCLAYFYLWLAGNEGMEKKMETTTMG